MEGKSLMNERTSESGKPGGKRLVNMLLAMLMVATTVVGIVAVAPADAAYGCAEWVSNPSYGRSYGRSYCPSKASYLQQRTRVMCSPIGVPYVIYRYGYWTSSKISTAYCAYGERAISSTTQMRYAG